MCIASPPILGPIGRPFAGGGGERRGGRVDSHSSDGDVPADDGLTKRAIRGTQPIRDVAPRQPDPPEQESQPLICLFTPFTPIDGTSIGRPGYVLEEWYQIVGTPTLLGEYRVTLTATDDDGDEAVLTVHDFCSAGRFRGAPRMKSEPEAGASTPTDPVKAPPKRVEEASETELFDALKAMFVGEEPNLVFDDPPRKGGMFRAECVMMLQDLNPPVYRELYRIGALEEYLDLASQSNRTLYMTLTAQGEGGCTTAGDGEGSGVGADARGNRERTAGARLTEADISGSGAGHTAKRLAPAAGALGPVTTYTTSQLRRDHLTALGCVRRRAVGDSSRASED